VNADEVKILAGIARASASRTSGSSEACSISRARGRRPRARRPGPAAAPRRDRALPAPFSQHLGLGCLRRNQEINNVTPKCTGQGRQRTKRDVLPAAFEASQGGLTNSETSCHPSLRKAPLLPQCPQPNCESLSDVHGS
jgi:hypothetical protein